MCEPTVKVDVPSVVFSFRLISPFSTILIQIYHSIFLIMERWAILLHITSALIHTHYHTNTNMKAYIPPWNSPHPPTQSPPGSVISFDFLTLRLEPDQVHISVTWWNLEQESQGQKYPLGRSSRVALTLVVHTHNKRQNYLLLLSHLWNTIGTRHRSPSRVNGSGRGEHHRKIDRDGPWHQMKGWGSKPREDKKNQLSERLWSTMDGWIK